MRIYKTPKPTKIVAVGLNYSDHAKELGMNVPKEPCLFLKPPTSVLRPNQSIIYPKESHQVDYEGELAIVIKKMAYRIPQNKINEYILGYTCANDVTARDLQRIDTQWTRAKSFDTFCPLGPLITDEIDPNNVSLRLWVNNELKQSGHTKNFIFNVQFLVAFISNIMTLLPEDVILTGTPKGVGPLNEGDKVEIEIEGIGRLINNVYKKD